MMNLVVILEDDLTMALYLKERINSIAGFHCQHIYHTATAFLNSRVPVDIIMLDVSMPGISGLEAIEPILQKYPEVSIVMNTIRDDDETIFQAMQRGAVGYVVKHDTSVVLDEVLQAIASGGAFMTPMIARKVLDHYKPGKPVVEEALSEREQQVVEDILEGLSYKLIAEKNQISINTVRKHIKRIYRKLNINSKGELFRLSRGR